MLSIVAANVNEAYYKTMMLFKGNNSLIESAPRGERRLQYPMPIATTYKQPCERVLFDKVRDANPFFHFMESLWIIAGRNDVAWLEQWLPRIRDFSDDGATFYGAYGERMRRYNQLNDVVYRLRNEKNTTRAVVSLYDASKDSDYKGKDMTCNCTIAFGVQNGRLNMTVFNRSNDMILGAYGANVVQFSMVQEYVAGLVNAKVGWYCQISNNAHIYPDHPKAIRVLSRDTPLTDMYSMTDCGFDAVMPYPMGAEDPRWDTGLHDFMGGAKGTVRVPFFEEVAKPMQRAHRHYRNREWTSALTQCGYIKAEDWEMACSDWIRRRHAISVAKGQT